MPSQDHKQALEGDKGPNTGGMGAYCPVDFVTPEILEEIQHHILEPTIAGLKSEEIGFGGVLYAGLMLTDFGPRVLEFNCRFGDPETQVVLPMLKNDLVELLSAAADKKLGGAAKLEWRKGAAACVVMASRGYPANYKTGFPINGIENVKDNNCQVFHAGTRRDNGRLLTAGGRVLAVVGINNDLRGALDRAYSAIRKIRFEGALFRKDIGFRVLQQKVESTG